MVKKRVEDKDVLRELTNEEIIESEDPSVEHSYLKIPRERLIPITLRSGRSHVWSDYDKIERELRKRLHKRKGKASYSMVHTHPDNHGIPSPEDIDVLNTNIVNLQSEFPYATTKSVIAPRDSNGKFVGYTEIIPAKRRGFMPDYQEKAREVLIKLGLRKGEEFDEASREETVENLNRYWIRNSNMMTRKYGNYINYLTKALRKAGLDIRFHPAKGYYFDKQTGTYEKKDYNLEGVVGSVLIGFLFLFLLIKIPFSGFVISNFISADYSLGFLVLLGLTISSLVYFALKPYKQHRNP